MSFLNFFIELGKRMSGNVQRYSAKDDGSRLFNEGTDWDEHWVLDEDDLEIPCYAITVETTPGQYYVYIDPFVPSGINVVQYMHCRDQREAEIATEYMQTLYSSKGEVTMHSPY